MDDEHINICLCGRQAGYGHEWDCPWPCYYFDPARDLEWRASREERRESLRQAGKATKGPDGWYYGRNMQRPAR